MQVTLLLLSLAVFFSYALQFYVLMEILGPNVIRPRVSKRWYSTTEYAVRVLINIITFGLGRCSVQSGDFITKGSKSDKRFLKLCTSVELEGAFMCVI